MPPRILVLSASVGSGHVRAAEAVELALRQLAPHAYIENHDALEFTNSVFRRMYGRAYLDLVNKAPHVLGYFYDLLDRPPSPQRKTDRLRAAVEKLNLRRLLQYVKEHAWDAIVSTHFLPAEMVAALRRKGEIACKHATVTTDFETHRLWVNQPCDRYFTATEEGAINLAHWGVPAEDIVVSGIPIHPAFSAPCDRAACLAAQELAGDRPVVLQLAGGFGVGPVEMLYRSLLQVKTPIDLVVVAGRNEELRARLAEIAAPDRHRTKVLGYTTAMHQLMFGADVVVTKPGGLTVSEALAAGAAIAVVNPIPGQESRNSDFLLENGAAVKINNLATLPHKLGRLLDERARLETLKANARRLGRPQAAFDVARTLLAMIQQPA